MCSLIASRFSWAFRLGNRWSSPFKRAIPTPCLTWINWIGRLRWCCQRSRQARSMSSQTITSGAPSLHFGNGTPPRRLICSRRSDRAPEAIGSGSITPWGCTTHCSIVALVSRAPRAPPTVSIPYRQDSAPFTFSEPRYCGRFGLSPVLFLNNTPRFVLSYSVTISPFSVCLLCHLALAGTP